MLRVVIALRFLLPVSNHMSNVSVEKAGVSTWKHDQSSW